MSNTPKLTDEQREEIQEWVKYRTGVIADKVNDLLSSERAWKSEAERLQESDINMIILDQLNQAIEVLKGIERNSLDGESRYRAHLFLSSLQEDKP